MPLSDSRLIASRHRASYYYGSHTITPARRCQLRLYPNIAVAYTKIVTITTDDIATANTFREAVGAPWPFLCDPERVVQKDLDIREYTDPDHDPMIPYTLVLEPELCVYKVYNGYWYWGRPSPEMLRQDLCCVTQRIRPDWDITAPGMREAWEAGDTSRFFPYSH